VRPEFYFVFLDALLKGAGKPPRRGVARRRHKATSGVVTLSTQYGPDETWPQHQKPFWKEVLTEARSAGWTLEYIGSHRFGVVSCPGGEDGNRHTFKVDQTAVGGETKSLEARKRIRNCRHGSVADGSKVRVRQAECERLLDQAERLINRADAGLARAEAAQAALTELERIQAQLETADANLIAILREEWEWAERALDDSEDAPTPYAIAEDLDKAVAAVTEGERAAIVLKVRRPHLAAPLLGRARAAKLCIEGLRARLKATS
jgi:hypothetical protein